MYKRERKDKLLWYLLTYRILMRSSPIQDTFVIMTFQKQRGLPSFPSMFVPAWLGTSVLEVAM